jgi:hypothetical protein
MEKEYHAKFHEKKQMIELRDDTYNLEQAISGPESKFKRGPPKVLKILILYWRFCRTIVAASWLLQ